MRRLLCWLGIHYWVYTYNGGWPLSFKYRDCRRCKKGQDLTVYMLK